MKISFILGVTVSDTIKNNFIDYTYTVPSIIQAVESHSQIISIPPSLEIAETDNLCNIEVN